MPMRGTAAAALLVLLAGCPGPEAACPDGAPCPRADMGDAVEGPEAPRIPWLAAGQPDIAPPDIPWLEAGQPDVAPPDIPWLGEGVPPIVWDCPTGWRALAEGGVATCDPYPEGGALECPDGEAHFPGEAGCAPVGSACGDGPFPAVDDLDPGAVVFADRTAPSGGDGERGSPFASLADALDATRSGDTVVLASGTYAVDRAWPDGVSLRGRCVRETSLVLADGNDRSAVLDIGRREAPIRVESVRIGPAPAAGILVRHPGAAVTLDGLAVEEVTGLEVGGAEWEPAALVVASSARVVARSLVVRDASARPDGEGGVGMSVDAGGRLEVERVVLERNRDVGVLVAGEGTQAVVEDLVVRGTLVRERDGALGRGVAVRSGARVELRRTLLERNRDLGLFVAGEGTEAVVEDLVVRDTRARESDGAFGYGLNVLDGGRLQLRRALVERNRGVGVFVSDEATEAVLEDVVVRDTLAQASDGAFGRGVGVQFGGRVELRRGLLERNRDVGVTSLEGAEAILEDVVVRDTRAQESDGAFGRGVEVLLGGRVELRRALLERNRDVGVSSLDGAEAILEDVVVRDTQAGASGGPSGLGLSVTFGARVELRRGLLERHRDAGVFVGHEGAEALLEDISIRETQAETAGVDRLGLNVLDGGRVDVRRGVLERNRDVGVLVAGEGTEAVLEDLVVRDTQARESDGTFGRGLNVQSGARAELRRALLERNREVGVFVAGEGTEALLEDVVVRETQPRRSDGASGSGLDVQRGARVELRRGLLERNRNLGVFVAGQGAEAVLEDLVVRDSRARESDGASGRGLNVQGGGRVELSRGLLERNRDLGLFVRGEGSRAVLEDVVVRDTQALESDGTGGEGLSAQLGGRIELRLGLLERNRSLGVLVAGAALDAEDVVVRDTLGPACRPECDSGAPGVSLGTFVESEVRLRRFELAAAEVCGLLVGHDGVRPGGGGLRLSDGLVRDHPVAVCLQDPAFPLALLQQGVRYADNAVLVDATGFPEPEPDPVVDPIEP